MKDLLDQFLEHAQEHGLKSEAQLDAERRLGERQLYLRERTRSIHQCNACGCYWRRWRDGTWSLADEKQQAGQCCDNSPDFLAVIVPTPR